MYLKTTEVTQQNIFTSNTIMLSPTLALCFIHGKTAFATRKLLTVLTINTS